VPISDKNQMKKVEIQVMGKMNFAKFNLQVLIME